MTREEIIALHQRASPDLYALGLTDQHIAALDAEAFRVYAQAPGRSRLEVQQALRSARAAAERADGITWADVLAVLAPAPV